MNECIICSKTLGKTKDYVEINAYGDKICGSCIAAMNKEYVKHKLASDVAIKIPIPSDIKKFLDEYVIGQESAKKILATAVFNHYLRICKTKEDNDVEVEKSNILMLGNTGTGKTYLLKTIARLLNVPFTIVDASTLTASGYVGSDVDIMLSALYEKAGENVKKAEKGIIYIDEFDKLGRKGENPSITRDVSGECVQQELLKIIEGCVMNVNVSGGRKHPQAPTIQMDTSNILFICGGSFEGIEKIIEQRKRENTSTSTIGFGAVSKKDYISNITEVTSEDVRKFGLLPEIIGRLPVIVPLEPLTVEYLKRILCEPKNCLFKQYAEMFKWNKKELVLEDEAIEAIAKRAYDKKTGSRGLRGIMEEILNPIMYYLPEMNTDKIVITKEMAENKEAVNDYIDKTLQCNKEAI